MKEHLIIQIIECVFLFSIIYGYFSQRTFLLGKFFYRTDGRMYWYVMIFHIYALGMFVHFFGWQVF